MPLLIVPDIPAWQVALLVGNLIAFVVLLTRIAYIGLAKSYPALTVWLGANVVVSLLPLAMHMDVKFYYWFYLCAESLTLILYVFTVLELYGKVLRDLAGIASAARLAIPVIVTASTIGSASLFAFEGRPARYIDWLYRVDRTVVTTLILFVLMITAVMVWFPIRVSRNTAVYSVGYAAYMVPKAAALFINNAVGHGPLRFTGAVCMAACTLCLVFWAVALDGTKETSVVSLGRSFNPAAESRLLAQLEAINRSLLRAAQK
jgi:hypothetical protein